ncbi:MAG: hypothetical protein ACRDJX_03720 [Solirubrobacteraceae bacterium]
MSEFPVKERTSESVVVGAALARPRRARRGFVGPEGVLAAIREWTERYGETPRMADWDVARARRSNQPWRVERYLSGDWPSLGTVLHHYGSLNAAVSAAGLVPRRPGGPAAGKLLRVQNWRRLAAKRATSFEGRHREMLVERVRAVAQASCRADSELLVGCLLDLAAVALGWADELRLGDPSPFSVAVARGERDGGGAEGLFRPPRAGGQERARLRAAAYSQRAAERDDDADR